MADQSGKRAASAPSRVRLPETDNQVDSEDGQEYKHIKLADDQSADYIPAQANAESALPLPFAALGNGDVLQQEGPIEALGKHTQNESGNDASVGQGGRGRALKRKADDNGAINASTSGDVDSSPLPLPQAQVHAQAGQLQPVEQETEEENAGPQSPTRRALSPATGSHFQPTSMSTVSSSPPAVAGSKRSVSKAALEAPSPTPSPSMEGSGSGRHVTRKSGAALPPDGSRDRGGSGVGKGGHGGTGSPGAVPGHQPKRGRVYASVLAEGLAGITLTEGLGGGGGTGGHHHRLGHPVPSSDEYEVQGGADEYNGEPAAQEGGEYDEEDEEDGEGGEGGGLRRPALPLSVQGPLRRRRLLQHEGEAQESGGALYAVLPTTTPYHPSSSASPFHARSTAIPASAPTHTHTHTHAPHAQADVSALSTVEPGSLPFVYRLRPGHGLDSATAEATVQALTSHHMAQALQTAAGMLEKLGIGVTFGPAPRPVPLHLVHTVTGTGTGSAGRQGAVSGRQGKEGGGNAGSRKRGASMAVEDMGGAPGAGGRAGEAEDADAGLTSSGAGGGSAGAARQGGSSAKRSTSAALAPVPLAIGTGDATTGKTAVQPPHSNSSTQTTAAASASAYHPPPAPAASLHSYYVHDRTDAHSVATGSSYGGGVGAGSASVAEGSGCVLLFTGFLPSAVSCDDLFALCSPHGRVLRVKRLFRKPDTALVEFARPQDATAALAALQNAPLKGRKLRVDRSKMTEVNVQAQDVSTGPQGAQGGSMVPTGPDGKAWAVDYSHL